MDGTSLRDYATEAIRYWEPRRLLYNLLLVAVVIATFSLNLPGSKAAVTIDSILWLFLLAVLANVAYCAAYIVDIFVQASAFRDQWKQLRWLLFTLGVAFAAVLARYFSVGLFAAMGATPG
jgi:glucan phosphoethanolaminetransferase (alkaline phosphatase superfamily)